MIKKEIIKEVEAEAKKYFKNANGCHDWTHVERVRSNALMIGKKEKADLFLLEIAALLHDIARGIEMKGKGKFCHAEKGAELAEQILGKYNFKKEQLDIILNAIKAHRFRNEHKPKSLVAKVLQDADKLDAIGAVGVGRTFLFAGNAGSKTMYTGNEKKIARLGKGKDYAYTKEDSAYLEYEVKLKHLKKIMNTKTGKKIAKDRDDFMSIFFRRFFDEVKGKK